MTPLSSAQLLMLMGIIVMEIAIVIVIIIVVILIVIAIITSSKIAHPTHHLMLQMTPFRSPWSVFTNGGKDFFFFVFVLIILTSFTLERKVYFLNFILSTLPVKLAERHNSLRQLLWPLFLPSQP